MSPVKAICPKCGTDEHARAEDRYFNLDPYGKVDKCPTISCGKCGNVVAMPLEAGKTFHSARLNWWQKMDDLVADLVARGPKYPVDEDWVGKNEKLLRGFFATPYCLGKNRVGGWWWWEVEQVVRELGSGVGSNGDFFFYENFSENTFLLPEFNPDYPIKPKR